MSCSIPAQPRTTAVFADSNWFIVTFILDWLLNFQEVPVTIDNLSI